MAGPRKRILVLGGTRAGRMIAGDLMAAGYDVISSLAGRTSAPVQPRGKVRSGGFGGPDGLAQFIGDEKIAAVVDATHAFAGQISANAVAAAHSAGVRLVRYERPAWTRQKGDRWQDAAHVAAAVAMIRKDARVLVTTGTKDLALFLARRDVTGLARVIEPYEAEVPPNWRVWTMRPPFDLEGERHLLLTQGIDVLVTKNSGGKQVSAKLAAARSLNIPVIMIARPVLAAARTVTRTGAVLAEITGLLRAGSR